MKINELDYRPVPALIDGKWLNITSKSKTKVYNPSNGEVIALSPEMSKSEVGLAIQSAKKAFPYWSGLAVTKRAEILFRYRGLLEANLESLARLITLENGKTIEEARGDIRRGFEVVEFACGIAHLYKGESLSRVATNIDGVTIREPLGVCVGISPFNFPAMVPMWMFPLAIACGNTFVLKPSEKVPLTAIRLAELFEEAGLPEGVLNIVHGGKEVVDTLCSHPDVAAISFVGSSHVAKHVYSLGSAHGKRVQAGGGAKNALIVMPDADPESTLRAIMGSAFGCAGQRCMAGSILMGVGEVYDQLRDRLVATIDSFKTGDTYSDSQMDMGAVIDDSSQKRINQIISEAAASGLRLTRDGREGIPDQGFFVKPTLLEQVSVKDKIFREEAFGPVLSLMHPANIEEAFSWVNQLSFGNGATLFTNSGASAQQFMQDVKCGMLGINVGVPAAMSVFPFSGWDDSFYGDLHMQGTEGVMFYTRQKLVLSRWDNNYHRQMGW